MMPSSWSRQSNITSNMGYHPKMQPLKAMEEVSGPVIGIALVLSAVFIPWRAWVASRVC